MSRVQSIQRYDRNLELIPTGLAPSPDRSIAATSRTDGIVLTSIVGEQLLADAVQSSGLTQLTISPSGRYVTLSEFGNGKSAFAVDLDTGNRTEFPVGPGGVGAAAGFLGGPPS